MREQLKVQGFFSTLPRAPFGLWTAYDLESCNPKKIKDTLNILKFFQNLEDDFQLKEHLPPEFGSLNNGQAKGSFFFHLLKRAHLVGYFLEETASAYIDIFASSDQTIKASGVSSLIKRYFDPRSFTIHSIMRD